MSEVYLKPISNNNIQLQKPAQKPKEETPSKENIDKTIKAEGTKKIGEEALEKAISELSKMLEGKHIEVSTVYDAKSGQQRVSLTDGNTGKKLVQIPPDAAVEMAEKSKQENIGWLLDRLV